MKQTSWILLSLCGGFTLLAACSSGSLSGTQASLPVASDRFTAAQDASTAQPMPPPTLEPPPTPEPTPDGEVALTGCRSYLERDANDFDPEQIALGSYHPLTLLTRYQDCSFDFPMIAFLKFFSFDDTQGRFREITTRPVNYVTPPPDAVFTKDQEKQLAFARQNQLTLPIFICSGNFEQYPTVRIYAETELNSGEKIISPVFTYRLTSEEIATCKNVLAHMNPNAYTLTFF